jgi:hypothetical protein
MQDRWLVQRTGQNGLRRIVVDVNVRMEQLRLLIHVLFVVLAASSLLWPIDDLMSGHPLPLRLISDRLLLIFATMCLATKSWLARHARHAIVEHSRHRRFTDEVQDEP